MNDVVLLVTVGSAEAVYLNGSMVECREADEAGSLRGVAVGLAGAVGAPLLERDVTPETPDWQWGEDIDPVVVRLTREAGWTGPLRDEVRVFLNDLAELQDGELDARCVANMSSGLRVRVGLPA